MTEEPTDSMYALEAEVSVLGACLADPSDSVPQCLDILDPSDFYNHDYRAVYRAVVEVYRRGESPDLVTVAGQIKDSGGLDSDQDPLSLVAELIDTFASSANVENHAQRVADKATLRRLVKATGEIRYTVENPEGRSAPEIVSEAERLVFEVGKDAAVGGWERPSDRIHDVFANVEKIYEQEDGITGVPSGFGDIDRMTGGFDPGNLVIIAARPAMGKTSLALNMATNAALDFNEGVALFSLEMTKDELVQRILFSEARVDMNRVKEGRMKRQHWERLSASASKLNHAPIWIEDRAGLSILEVQAMSRRLAAREDIGIIVVDYIQLLTARAESRVQEVALISRGLKGLAKELEVPVVGLSQLSRAPEKRSDHRPKLSDLRESGDIEQDADIVSFLYRPSYYSDEPEPRVDATEFIIGKHRNGPTGTVPLVFQKNYTRFDDPASKQDEQRAA